MKTSEQFLSEWARDRISFRVGNKKHCTKEELEKILKEILTEQGQGSQSMLSLIPPGNWEMRSWLSKFLKRNPEYANVRTMAKFTSINNFAYNIYQLYKKVNEIP